MLSLLNNKLTVKHYVSGYDTLSLQAALDTFLTNENIPVGESKNFLIKTNDGYYIGYVAAWNNDWISGHITRAVGVDTTMDAYYFTRQISAGADTVLKKLGSNSKRLKSFVLSGYATGSGGRTLSNSTTVYCNYDSDGNFTGFSSASTSWASNVSQGYGAGGCSVYSGVME